jgi:hypothetical protein
MTAVDQGSVIFVPKLAQRSAQSGVGFVKLAKAINYYSSGTVTGRVGATGVGGLVPGGTNIIASRGSGRTTPVVPPGTTINNTFAPGGTGGSTVGFVAGGTSTIMPPATSIIDLSGRGQTTLSIIKCAK